MTNDRSRCKPSLLIVDDSDMLLQSMQRVLGDEYAISVARAGEEALAIYDRLGPFSIVLTDQRMFGLSGFELAGLLRERDPNCVCLLLSGEVGGLSHLQSQPDSCIFRILAKPCPVEQLIVALEEAFNERCHRIALTDVSLAEGATAIG